MALSSERDIIPDKPVPVVVVSSSRDNRTPRPRLSQEQLPPESHHSNYNSSYSESFDVSSDSTSSNDDKDDKNNSKEKILAAAETRWVRRFRCLTISAILVTAVVISTLTYFYIRNVELSVFTSEYYSHGNKVINAFQDDSYRKMQALFSLSSTITSHAIDSNSTWPFVSLPNSASVLGPYLSLADAAALTLLPVVTAEQRAEWESYSVKNQDWIEKDLSALGFEQQESETADSGTSSGFISDGARRRRKAREVTAGTDSRRKGISPYIKNYVGVDTSSTVYFPWWQYAPVIPNRWFVNFNRLAWKGFKEEAATVRAGRAALSQTTAFEPGLDQQSTRDFEFTNQLLRARGGAGYDSGEPLSYIFYPIFDRLLHGKNMSDASNAEMFQVVAILSATVYWRSYFQGILPDNVRGIICVVENSAGQAFSYQINGRRAIFLGMDDLHDPQYDHMEIAANYSAFLRTATADDLEEGRSEYTGVPVDEDHLVYTIRVFPSQTMQFTYTSTNPQWFAVAIFCVFIVCVFVFLLYNWIVERRQKVVLTTANRTSAVIESVFPATVREKVMEEVADKQKRRERRQKQQGRSSKLENWKSSGRNFNDLSSEEIGDSEPIADFFPEASVFFADVKGFTAWCSARQPKEVFRLLETIYASVDLIAERRRIFKVETVGDCYVATCGLPIQRKDHAVAMCRFAREVLHKVNDLVSEELPKVLGPETRDLNFRVGIHSGPVTAGVIRGGNARFQIFGDTVNTASRMESTGSPGRVQLSEATAEYLRIADKEHWFYPREEKVAAKGKGELQTYWLILESRDASTGWISESSRTLGLDFDNNNDDIVPPICGNIYGNLEVDTQELASMEEHLMSRIGAQGKDELNKINMKQREAEVVPEIDNNVASFCTGSGTGWKSDNQDPMGGTEKD